MKIYSISELNDMDRNSFREALGSIFEHSPWVAEQAWYYRPFDTKKSLHAMMVTIVQQSTETVQLALIKQHPDLASRLQMSEMSVKEQEGVGLLSSLSADEYAMFSSLNKEYTGKFGFPFIIAVKGKTKEIIMNAMKSRINHEPEEEKQRALLEISSITSYRMDDMVQNG